MGERSSTSLGEEPEVSLGEALFAFLAMGRESAANLS